MMSFKARAFSILIAMYVFTVAASVAKSVVFNCRKVTVPTLIDCPYGFGFLPSSTRSNCSPAEAKEAICEKQRLLPFGDLKHSQVMADPTGSYRGGYKTHKQGRVRPEIVVVNYRTEAKIRVQSFKDLRLFEESLESFLRNPNQMELVVETPENTLSRIFVMFAWYSLSLSALLIVLFLWIRDGFILLRRVEEN